MNDEDIRYLLVALKLPINDISYTGSSKQTRWMNTHCPFAPWTHQKKTDLNPSFGITVNEDGHSHYKCLSCLMKGRLANLPNRLGGYRGETYNKLQIWAASREMQTGFGKPLPKWDDADPLAIDCDKTKPPPPPSTLHAYPLAIGVPYLRKRGILLHTALKLCLRYDAYQQRVLFPVYDEYDQFRGFTGRSIQERDEWPKDYPKVKDYFGLNKRQVFLGLPGQQPGPKIITEGLLDYGKQISFGQYNAKAALGTSLTDAKAEILIAQGEPVYLFFDNDQAGWQAVFGVPNKDGSLNTANAWAYRLYKEIPVWIVPYGGPLDGRDPGKIRSKRQNDAMLKKAWLFTGRAPDETFDKP